MVHSLPSSFSTAYLVSKGVVLISAHPRPLLGYKLRQDTNSAWFLLLDLEDSSSVPGQPHFYQQNLFPNSPYFRTPGVQRTPKELHLPDLSLQHRALPPFLVHAKLQLSLPRLFKALPSPHRG